MRMTGIVEFGDLTAKISVPTAGKISKKWRDWMFGIIERGPWKTDGIHFVFGKSIEIAREEICDEAISGNVDFLIQVDDDIFPPAYFLTRLLDTAQRLNADIVNCPCWLKHPFGSMTFFDFVEIENDQGVRELTTYPMKEHLMRFGGVQEYDIGGCGCILLRTSFLKKLERPLFRLGYTGVEKRNGLEMKYCVRAGEDFWLHHQAHKANGRLFLDCGICCDHYHVEEEKFYPEEDLVGLITGQTEKRFYEVDQPAWFFDDINNDARKGI